jgi:hypothetical protein
MEVDHGGQTWRSNMEVDDGGQTWRSIMEVDHGGRSWRSLTEVVHERMDSNRGDISRTKGFNP